MWVLVVHWESGSILGTILANASVPMIPQCCYGKLPASLHLWRTAAVYPQLPHCSAHCPSWIIFPFLLQILNHCCQTVLSLKDMYSLLPGSSVCERLLSLMVTRFWSSVFCDVALCGSGWFYLFHQLFFWVVWKLRVTKNEIHQNLVILFYLI